MRQLVKRQRPTRWSRAETHEVPGTGLAARGQRVRAIGHGATAEGSLSMTDTQERPDVDVTGLVDEAALLDALRENRLGGAGLDVLEREPPLADSPLMRNRPENLIITPHTAWASRESRQRLINELSKNIVAYHQGQPRNTV